MKNLAIIITHPIQYYAPVFKLLATQCNLMVFYTWGFEGAESKVDKGFNKKIAWDIPLLDGYAYEFLENKAKERGSHHFWGINNPDIIQRVGDFKPNAILIYGWAYYSHLKVLRYFKGKTPIWFRGDSHLLDSKPLWKKLARKILLTWVYSYIDKSFYVGAANKAYYESFGLKEHQLIFAPHAVDNKRFSEVKADEVASLRKNLEIGEQETLILFAGKLERKKNPELLLQAFVDLKMDNVHLLFVGNGELEESLKLKAESLKQNIHFMDFQNQSYMPVVYQACDLFCLPSQGPNETWGLAVNETMAAGKAILISDKVGCYINLIHENNGHIFKSSDLSSLQECLTKVLNNDLNEMGQYSKQIINEWSFKNQVSVFVKTLYEG